MFHVMLCFEECVGRDYRIVVATPGILWVQGDSKSSRIEGKPYKRRFETVATEPMAKKGPAATGLSLKIDDLKSELYRTSFTVH